MKKFALALATLASLLATTANAAITYSGSLTPAVKNVTTPLSASFTITTDGTLGALGPSNFIGYTLSINDNGTFINSSGSGVLSNFGVGAIATSTTLSLDFGNPAARLVFFDNNSFLCILGGSTCVGEPSPSISFGNGIGGVRGHTLQPGSLQVIATAAAVPEPASWAMLIAGFGLCGAAMRRRKAVVAA